MSRIRRYHPISHSFNRDTEIIEARKRFGDWIGFAWLECLSIADRNEGIVQGTVEQIADILAPISLQKYHKYAADKAQTFLKLAKDFGWIEIEPTRIVVLKYGEYHPKRGANQAPSETSETSEHPKIKNAAPLVVDNLKNGKPESDGKPEASRKPLLDARIKSVADKIFASNPGRFGRLVVWIKTYEKRDYEPEIIASALEMFWVQEQKTPPVDWWPYLDKVLRKAYVEWQQSQSSRQNQKDKEFLSSLMGVVSRGVKA